MPNSATVEWLQCDMSNNTISVIFGSTADGKVTVEDLCEFVKLNVNSMVVFGLASIKAFPF